MSRVFLAGVCLLAVGCGSGSRVSANLGAIAFETASVPAAGAGQLYNVVVRFTAAGGAALPERFTITSGVLPPGVTLAPDRADLNQDGLPDKEGALTGHARILGFPREKGSFRFTVKAVSTGALGKPSQPDLSASREFTINVGEGSVSILTPTAAEGTSDPAVPAFPDVISFVNPANPSAFFSFAWEIAGGSGKNTNAVYVPRELELSTFDSSVAADPSLIDFDTNESAKSGDKFEPDFADGGLFALQAGNSKVQVGGFQSPRGPVGTLTRYEDGPGLDPDWFQVAPGASGPPLNSRRTFADTTRTGGDAGLGTAQPVQFSDYFDPRFAGTQRGATPRSKYPFPADQYMNAFFVPFTAGVDITPLRFRVIVESIDTRGTVTNRNDDVISRKAYIVQVRIPDVVIDSVVLPGGTAGVDYTVFVAASGGVPPLRFELEHVDGIADGVATANAPGELTKQDFGLELGRNSGQFFGVPRASGPVDLTVRVYADVMNPTQGGSQAVPTGNAGELDGTHPLTGKTGRHKTFTVSMAAPSAPVLVNKGLKPGVDGFSYPGDRLVGLGGVARLVPYPVGFTGTYPASTVQRNYAWSASYIRDASHGAGAGSVDPSRQLPNNLILDGDPLSATSGTISGITYDRGFHPVTFRQTDAYVGSAGAPSAASAQVVNTLLALSVSPDSALYLRGRPTAQGGEPTGLLDATAQMGEARMVPMCLAASLHSVDTGTQPIVQSWLPAKFDLLPVMLPHGGNDNHNRKSIPSITGFWPAEANTEADWNYLQTRAWKHLQQEMVWLQVPDKSHTRVFLWGETTVKKWNSSNNDFGWGKKYQQMDANGKRGILVVEPLTGAYHVPAILDNNSASHGTQFGAEAVVGGGSTSGTNVLFCQYWKYYYYLQDTAWDREVQVQGLSSYIEGTGGGNSSQGWYRQEQGRTAISVAMSADGKWCATAMPGGTGQKILLFRTDKQPIPAGILARPYVASLQGRNADGTNMTSTVACILNLGGQTFGGRVLTNNQQHLLPDSLMFVRDGLVFLNETILDHVFGVSLVDGSLSSRNLNVSRTQVNGAGLGPNVFSTMGFYVPDQDHQRGLIGSNDFGCQFAFAGNEPAAGSTGPDKLAFVAGESRFLGALTDLGAQPRDGYVSSGNRRRSLFFLETATGASGLNLDASVLKDLTGSSTAVNGDLLTPGRPGEELDFLTVSRNGNYVAVVRELHVGPSEGGGEYVAGGFGSTPSFHTYFYYNSGTPGWEGTDDLLLVSTQGVDMDSNTGATEHVLYVGSATTSPNSTANPVMPSYAVARPYLNAAYRRIRGLQFGQDERTLLFTYSGGTDYNPKYFGEYDSWGVNPYQSGTFAFGTEISVRLHFRTTAGAAINFSSVGNNMANALTGLTGVGNVGPASPNFGDTGSVDTNFWATFRSPNGNFLYYINDGVNGRNWMVGLNTTGATINGRQSYVPFSPHAATVGFEQFNVNAFNYANRFAAVPAGVFVGTPARDGAGIMCVIASDSTAGATSSTDLEVYAFNADLGTNLVALTSAVTDGTANALNHLYLSADGNVLVGQRCKTTGVSRDSRALLNSDSDLFAVANIHAVLYDGAAPNAVKVSTNKSHGSSVAFVGEGTTAGPQAVIFSAAAAGTANTTWSTRTLQIALLQSGAIAETLDNTQSHYAVLAGGRKLDDNATTGN